MRKAFSLVELLLALAITSIVTASILVIINKDQKDTKILEAEGRKMSATIKALQNAALTGVNQQNGCSYDFSAATNATLYTTAGCTSETYQLANNVSIRNGASFSFTAPQGKVYQNGLALDPTQTITITLKRNNVTYVITVTGSGLVRAGS